MNNSTLTLDSAQFAHLRGRPGRRVRVACGSVWLTIDGQQDDHVLRRGDSLPLPERARVLMQALDAPARVVVHDRPALRLRLWAALGRAASSWISPRVPPARWGTLL